MLQSQIDPRRARIAISRHSLPLLGALVMLAGCGREPIASETAAARGGNPQPRTASVEHRDLATLRAATARFHRFAAGEAAGYTFLFMNMCMVDQSAANRGGMGLHQVNLALLDGSVNVATPEALLYEPRSNGQRRLVAVEYVIPKAAWQGDRPPVLFGRDFTLNAFDLWALHVWVWKRNPSGLYADWNPRVSCEHASVPAAGRHH